MPLKIAGQDLQDSQIVESLFIVNLFQQRSHWRATGAQRQHYASARAHHSWPGSQGEDRVLPACKQLPCLSISKDAATQCHKAPLPYSATLRATRAVDHGTCLYYFCETVRILPDGEVSLGKSSWWGNSSPQPEL